MDKTLAEKILSTKAGTDAFAGDIVVAEITHFDRGYSDDRVVESIQEGTAQDELIPHRADGNDEHEQEQPVPQPFEVRVPGNMRRLISA